jgi:hypothetical protein
MTSNDWPFGPMLRAARERIRPKLSIRKAAELADISEAMWRKLENGYYMVQGKPVFLVGSGSERTGTTPRTVRAVAKVVGLDVNEALRTAGFPEEVDAEPPAPRDEAFENLKSLWVTFERAWGREAADKAIDKLYRSRHAASITPPDRPNG